MVSGVMESARAQRWAERTETALKAAGHRASAPRAAIVSLLARQSCCLTAREITDALRADGRDVGTATVYRTLELLLSIGALQRLDAGEGFARYEPWDPAGAHHHHLICERCGHVSAFEDERLEEAIDALAARLPHRVEGHEVVLRGACRDCAGTPAG